MGFELEETVYRLTFTEPKYEGLVVKTKEMSIGEMVEMAKLDHDGDSVPTEVLDAMFDLIAEGVVEWNLERGGEPVGTDITAIRKLPATFVMDLLRAWQFTVVGVPGPLDDGSMNGKPPPELLLQTAV